jgi:hypothetical protein
MAPPGDTHREPVPPRGVHLPSQHPFSQAVLEKCGFKLVGIVPAHDRDRVRPGTVKRVFEALYIKLLVPPEEILEPSLDALLPETRRLYEFLFKQR